MGNVKVKNILGSLALNIGKKNFCSKACGLKIQMLAKLSENLTVKG